MDGKWMARLRASTSSFPGEEPRVKKALYSSHLPICLSVCLSEPDDARNGGYGACGASATRQRSQDEENTTRCDTSRPTRLALDVEEAGVGQYQDGGDNTTTTTRGNDSEGPSKFVRLRRLQAQRPGNAEVVS
jgi:hypothetical protein